MAEVGIGTLFYAIKSVNAQIREFDRLLECDICPNRADIQDLTLCYERVLEDLKRAYVEELPGVSNYPSYEELIQAK